VDLVGIEPTTSSMPWKRAPKCTRFDTLALNFIELPLPEAYQLFAHQPFNHSVTLTLHSGHIPFFTIPYTPLIQFLRPWLIPRQRLAHRLEVDSPCGIFLHSSW